MKAKYNEPKVEKYVVITLKESEAKSLRDFLGGTSESDRRKICEYKINDEHLFDLCKVLDFLNN